MILRGCKWDTGSGGEPPRPKKKRGKRRVSPRMRKANKSNSMKSTGPKSAQGKAAVSVNAVVHGCACKELIFLDDEDPRLFWADVELRAAQRNAVTVEERNLVITIAYAELTKVRALNGDATAINEARAQIRDEFADRSGKAVRDILPRLATEPDLAAEELANSTCGCEYLIGQFELLAARLSAYPAFEVSQRGEAFRLGGHRPNELFGDRDVFDLNKAYFGAISGPGSFTADGAGNALQYDMPEAMSYTEFVRRLGPLVQDLPTREEGHRRLQKYVAEEIARLTERKKLVATREARKLQAALGMAQAPTDKAAVTRQRYVAGSDRTANAAQRTLLALQNDRRKHGDEYQTVAAGSNEAEPGEPASEPPAHEDILAPEAAVSAALEAPSEELIPSEAGQIPNKAVAPEVVGPIGGCNPISADPAVTPAVPAGDSDDPLLALVKKYAIEMGHPEAFDQIE